MIDGKMKLLISSLIFTFCVLSKGALEKLPLTHILVQLPLLICVGYLLVEDKSQKIGEWYIGGEWNKGGYASLLIAIFTIAFWMLPRSIDAAISSGTMELLKFLTVPLLIGVPLKLGWHRTHPILKGFLKAQAISMLGVAAFIYIHAPIRICNSYLENAQQDLGYGFLYTSIALAVIWSAPLFLSQSAKSFHLQILRG
ncbi:MAG: hypothetical protein DHS20C07_00270 [Methyloligella sp.]|nr:MAG: hypothetical protein DHS20C07_00270 [Methyloligella sp.]